ncbi:hypothetical protein BP5796_08239 [Coleophoma crateriformis]|uniref:Uncharacterized protein n=1 Tax=Coleophoma crateriformis TaxID=565419 RepID=A0A3D8RDU0_9HELO|nr:hypothetical protein BP5796_08239 [Coleophoma crateriformis]
MRLLTYDSAGQLSLTSEFVDDNIPRYAILSHTWGADREEVTYQDLVDGTGINKSGYKKIYFCGEQARRDGLQHFWVDTCCIDKKNSVELSEAINSMFSWYQKSSKCYVYLSDVSTNGNHQSAFQESRWFTRGWTLQELIAPRSVEFYGADGSLIGDKTSLEQQLHAITGIAVSALQGTTLSMFSFEERMSWANARETKREEDKVYSLLGMFDVHIPLIYGEGAKNAFERLREKIYKRGKKRQLDDVSTVFQATPTSAKRQKTSYNESFVISRRNTSLPDLSLASQPNYTSYSIDATTKQSLIDQLYFTKIDERLTSLTAAQGNTCRWFLAKPEFIAWHTLAQLPDHGGFLWIKGNPGTGKSTLMKFLFEDAKLNAKGDPSKITLSFFFLARGTVEEKSTTGLYRSLLHQLFAKDADLQDSLEWMTADGARVLDRNGWHEEALKQTFTHAIRKLGSRTLTIFVDALDECDKDHATGMVCFFEELCDCARETQVRLQICFSSRHYPTITIEKGIEVTLEAEIGHTEDLQKYIKSRLRLGRSTQAQSLRSEILEKSSGIFLWAVLVIDILNSEYPKSSGSTKKMRERLREIPPGLTELFKMILARDGENLEQLEICLKWILFAAYPLKPEELYFAIQLGLEKECSGFWDQEDIDLNQIKTFVRSSSKGLAEVTRTKASHVQFIHESVRDFLLGKYEGQWSGDTGNFVGRSHDILKGHCFSQLNTSISQEVDITDPLPKASDTGSLRENLKLKFPFLEYSVLNVLYHANIAQQNTIDQGESLTNFPLQQWIVFNNILEKFDIRRYRNRKSVSILYILAEKNFADLLRIHPQRASCFEVEDERYGPPFFAALATGSNETVRAILDLEAENYPLASPIHDLCKKYYGETHKRTGLGRDFAFSWHDAALSYVVKCRDETLLSILLETGKYMLNGKDIKSWTPLLWAASGGLEAVVTLLLEKGAEVNLKDNSGQTPMSWAAMGGHEAVVKLLLEKGAEVDSKDNSGCTPMYWAARKGHEAVVKLLLEKGAEVDLKDTSDQKPLSLAAIGGHEAVVKLLLEKGAEVDSEDTSGWTPMSWAAALGHEAVVKLLLEKGAEVDSKDISGRTPISCAAINGREAVVKLLSEKGAEVDSKDSDRRTPMSLAANGGYKAVVKLLLEKGAEVESKDTRGWTPMSWAAAHGHEAVVKLLLEKGAEVDSKDNSGRTPMSLAANGGHEAVVKLLLEKGAEVDS